MGSSTSTTTQSTTIPGIGGQEQEARDLLMGLAQGAEGQMGDLSALASGQLQLSPQMQAMLTQIQELSAQGARSAIQDSAAMQSSQLEDRLLSKGLGGSTIEAVDEALIGRQLQQSLDQSAIQGQVETQRQRYQGAFDQAGVQLNANQLLLNKLLGGAGAVSNAGLQERLVQQTSTRKTKDPFDFSDVANIAGRGLAAYASGGTSELAAAPGIPGSPYQGPPAP